MNMIWHNDKGMQLIMSFSSVVLERLKKKLSILFYLKDAKTIVCAARDEECAGPICARRNRHGGNSKTYQNEHEEFR